MSEEGLFLNVGVLTSIGLMMIYLLLAHVLEHLKIDFLHESGIAVLLGALAGLGSFTVSNNFI